MNRNTQIPSLPINKQQQRLYPASIDPTFEHETYKAMQEYLNNATAYVGQVLYCKENDKHYRIAHNNGQMMLKEVMDKAEYDSKLDNFSEQLGNKAKQSDLEILENRMDIFTALPEGSTSGDAEIADGRVGANGRKYSNIGGNIRDIASGKGLLDNSILFEKMDKMIIDLFDEKFDTKKLSENSGYMSYTGAITPENGWKHWECVGKASTKYVISGQSWLSIPAVLFLDNQNKVLDYYPKQQDSSTTNYKNVSLVSPANTHKVIVNRMLTREFGITERSSVALKPTAITIGKDIILNDNILNEEITFEKLDSLLKNCYDELYNDERLTSNNGYLSRTGVVTNDDGWKHWGCDAKPYCKYKVSGQSWLSIPLVLFMDNNNKVISYYPANEDKEVTNYTDVEIVAPINASKIIVHRKLAREFGIKKRYKIIPKPVVVEKNKTKLAIIGDSLSANDSPQASVKYHTLLVQNDNYEIINLARGGHGYKREDDGDNSFFKQATKVPHDADMVFIFGSFNDLGKVIDGQYTIGESVDNASNSTNTIMECINRTINNIRAIRNDIIIVIASPTPWANYHPGGGANKDISEKYAKAIETVAHNQNCIFLDLFHESNIWSWNSNWNTSYCPDGVHLNDAGHKRYLYPIIRNTLNKVNPNQ